MVTLTRVAYSYLRFSTPDQLKGDSLRRQTAASQSYCVRHGLTLDTTLNLKDLGVSAFRGRNADTNGKHGLAVFLRAIETGRVTPGATLIVESLDRLSRNRINEALTLFLGILQGGISIVTLTPERHYTDASVGDIVGLLEPLVVMSRAHEESTIKANRLRSAWSQKRKTAGDHKLTKACPAWLRLSADRTRFHVVPESAAIVKQIFELAINGYGTNAIAKYFNERDIPSIGGRAKLWNRGYVMLILKSRSTIGEYQPHVMQDGQRVPCGEPIPGYFPAAVKESTFYRAQKALTSRRRNIKSNKPKEGKKRKPPIRKESDGSKSKFVNLFLGLIFDKSSGSPMWMVSKGPRHKRHLVASAAIQGDKEVPYLSVGYMQVEAAILAWYSDLHLHDVMPSSVNRNLSSDIERLEGKLAKLEQRIDSVNRQLRDVDNEDFETLVELLKKLQRDRKEVAEEMEVKKTELNNLVGTNTLKDTQTLVNQLSKLEGEKLHDLRLRLRAQLQLTIRRIDCQVVERSRYKRDAVLTVHLTNGKAMPPVTAAS